MDNTKNPCEICNAPEYIKGTCCTTRLENAFKKLVSEIPVLNKMHATYSCPNKEEVFLLSRIEEVKTEILKITDKANAKRIFELLDSSANPYGIDEEAHRLSMAKNIILAGFPPEKIESAEMVERIYSALQLVRY